MTPQSAPSSKLIAAFAAMRRAVAETRALLTTHLLTLDDATLRALGHSRAALRTGGSPVLCAPTD